ncbi:MAG: SgcJ/EcaC family oxidoreductase [Pseudomonadota bacterium]|uniref:YybH family protein n=1 Tax=Sphingomonas sp. ERG5 TaxID=1381597 RepID=UPI00054B68B3|nr:SgcJ/EcaC family oxidoreductase [Sphingomonas sp. ERG5]
MRSEDHKAIKRVLETYVEAWGRHDLDAWAALFSEMCDFVTWSGVWWHSRAENRAGHGAIPDSIIAQMANYRLTVSAIRPLSSDTALVHAFWDWPAFELPGGGPEDRTGIITMVLARSDDHWLIRASHNTRIS